MQIVPTDKLQTPLGSEVTELTITVRPFQLFQTNIMVDWLVSGPTTERSGTLGLPSNIIAQWGTDDTVVENWVLSQLNLTRA